MQSFKKGSANTTLRKIEQILDEEFKYSENKTEIEQLRQRAKIIHDKFLEKTSHLSSFRRWLGNVTVKEQEIKALYKHIEELADRLP